MRVRIALIVSDPNLIKERKFHKLRSILGQRILQFAYWFLFCCSVRLRMCCQCAGTGKQHGSCDFFEHIVPCRTRCVGGKARCKTNYKTTANSITFSLKCEMAKAARTTWSLILASSIGSGVFRLNRMLNALKTVLYTLTKYCTLL